MTGQTPAPSTARPFPRVAIVGVVILTLLLTVTSGLTLGSAAQPAPGPTASPDVATPASSPVASPDASPAALPASAEFLINRSLASRQRAMQPPARRPLDALQQEDNPAHDTGDDRRPLRDGRHVFDPYELLSSEEESRVAHDARRLSNNGVPTFVYLRVSEAPPERAQEYADQLRQEWEIASAPGADDGLVILVSRRIVDRDCVSVVFSYGANTLPDHGLTRETLNTVYQEHMLPELRDGDIYGALTTGLRRIGYLVIYFPVPDEPLSGRAQEVHRVLEWLAPTAVAAFVIGYGAVWLLPKITTRPLWRAAAWRSGRILTLLSSVALVIVAGFALYGESAIGAGCAFLLLGLILLHIFAFSPRDPVASTANRILRVSPHGIAPVSGVSASLSAGFRRVRKGRP